MGGNAFPNLNVVRVKREDIPATLHHMVEQLAFPGLTHEYVAAHLLGSAGKQADSGDLDVALNNRKPRFVGEPNLPVFDLRALAARCREVLPEGHVNTRTMNSDFFNSAWPVAGDFTKGLVQVDFMLGDPKWLKYSHWSPGASSEFKGVAISTLWGVMAKMRKDFEAFEDGSFNMGDEPWNPDDERVRVARVGLAYNLEKGLHRKWEVSLRKNQGPTVVEPEVFETRVANAPRFPRTGMLTDPDVVLSVLYGVPTTEADVPTFELAVARLREVMPERFTEARERFLEAFQRSSGANGHNIQDTASHPVWD
jgi:hypothetical protein